MRLLLDAHALLWALGDPAELSDPARAALEDPANDVVVSAATVWEIAIKESIGKLRVDAPLTDLARAFDPLAITYEHALAAAALPPHHRDPFDRMLVAQAAIEGLVVVTRDREIARYGGRWLEA